MQCLRRKGAGGRGAFSLAAHPLRPLDTTRAMIHFDMIGRNEELRGQTTGPIEIPANTTNRLNLISALYSPDYPHTTDTAEKINCVKMANILRTAYLTAFDFAGDTPVPKFVASPPAAGEVTPGYLTSTVRQPPLVSCQAETRAITLRNRSASAGLSVS